MEPESSPRNAAPLSPFEVVENPFTPLSDVEILPANNTPDVVSNPNPPLDPLASAASNPSSAPVEPTIASPEPIQREPTPVSVSGHAPPPPPAQQNSSRSQSPPPAPVVSSIPISGDGTGNTITSASITTATASITTTAIATSPSTQPVESASAATVHSEVSSGGHRRSSSNPSALPDSSSAKKTPPPPSPARPSHSRAQSTSFALADAERSHSASHGPSHYPHAGIPPPNRPLALSTSFRLSAVERPTSPSMEVPRPSMAGAVCSNFEPGMRGMVWRGMPCRVCGWAKATHAPPPPPARLTQTENPAFNNRRGTAGRAGSTETSTPCLFCGKPLKAGVWFCVSCGRRSTPSTVTQVPADLENWELVTEDGAIVFRDIKSGKSWSPAPPPPEEDASPPPTNASTPASSPNNNAPLKIDTQGSSTPRAAAVAASSSQSSELFWLSSNNIHAIAESLDIFFKDLFTQKPTLWAGILKDKLMFPLVSRPAMVQAFLYGERSAIPLEGHQKRMQDWLRWITPLFSQPLDDFDEDGDIMPAPKTPTHHRLSLEPTGLNPALTQSNEHPNRSLATQATLLTVTLLHFLFRDGQPEPFALQLSQFINRMQGLGWNETNLGHVHDVLKAFVCKIAHVDALQLKQNFEHKSWENMVVLGQTIEEFCFFTAFEVQTELGTVGFHLDAFGSADKDLLLECDRLFNTKLSVSTPIQASEIIRDAKDAKDYKTRKGHLAISGAFFASASKWAEVFGHAIEEAVRTSNDPKRRLIHTPSDSSLLTGKNKAAAAAAATNADGKVGEGRDQSGSGMMAVYDLAVNELLEFLGKHRGFRKKQAMYMFYQSIENCRVKQIVLHNSANNIKKEGEVDKPAIEMSWDDVLPETILEQTKASNYLLRRMIRFTSAAIKTQADFVSASEKVLNHEVQKAYFCPAYDTPLPRHEDYFPAVIEASASLMNLTSAFTLRVKSFVEEVQAEVIAPLINLKAAYEEAANLFQQQYQSVEKTIELERQRILKEYEIVEKEMADLQLVSFEYEESKKQSDAAQKKAQQKKGLVAQKVAMRVSKYEKTCKHFETHFRPATFKLLRAHTATLHRMERRRIHCSKLYVNRFLAAFARLNGAYSPVFEASTLAVAGLNETHVMNGFTSSVKQLTPPPPLPEPALSSSQILEGTPVSEAPVLVTCEHCHTLSSPEDITDGGCVHCGYTGKPPEDKEALLVAQFEVYMEDQGYQDAVREKMRLILPAHKQALLTAAQADAEAKHQKQELPGYWSKILAASNKLTSAQLASLKLVITSKGTKKWLQEFANSGGLDSMCTFLESKVDSAGLALKHEALVCLVTIMKNKAGLEVATKRAPSCLAALVGNSDYSNADKLVIWELLALVGGSEDGRRAIAAAFDQRLDALVRFCTPLEKCQKCALEFPPHALSCQNCQDLRLEVPLASLIVLNHIMQSFRDKDTAALWRHSLEELGINKIIADFRSFYSGSTSLINQCDNFDAFALKQLELPARPELSRSPSTASMLKANARKMDIVLDKVKSGLAKKLGVRGTRELSSEKVPAPGKHECESCGAEIPVQDDLCAECSALLAPPPDDVNSQ